MKNTTKTSKKKEEQLTSNDTKSSESKPRKSKERIKRLSTVGVKKIVLEPICETEEERKEYIEYISKCSYVQWRVRNTLMSELVASIFTFNRDLKSPEFEAAKKRILTGSNPSLDYLKEEKPVGLDIVAMATQKVSADFKKSIKNGLLKGDVSAISYKRADAVQTLGRDLKFFHGYSSDEELYENLYSKDLDIRLKWVNKKSFRVVFGSSKENRSGTIREMFRNIFNGRYEVIGSTIQLDPKNRNKIILNLACKQPVEDFDLKNKDVVVGVDLGLVNPAVCALNTEGKSEYIGNGRDFMAQRAKLKSRKRDIQQGIELNKGGKGREKKLKRLKMTRKAESTFAKNMNDQISRKIVDFAVHNHAAYINLENLTGLYEHGKTRKILSKLGDWTYYDLQQKIEYKASKVGIEVRYVNPYNTTQLCSFCGEEVEIVQNGFNSQNSIGPGEFRYYAVCKNPDCYCHKSKAYYPGRNGYIESDFNAARNIALSTDWSTGKKSFKESKEQHKKHKEIKQNKESID